MLSVTFSQPIVIEAGVLASLLSLANVPATVEPYLNGNSTPEPVVPAKRTRKPKAEAAPDGEPPVKRTRRTKAEMAALRAGVAPETAASAGEVTAQTTEAETVVATTTPVEAAPVEKLKRTRKPKAEKDSVPTGAVALDSGEVKPAETVSAEGLLERFAKLIDADFAAAKKLLDEFGVNRFSDLAPTDHAAFQAKLVELGV